MYMDWTNDHSEYCNMSFLAIKFEGVSYVSWQGVIATTVLLTVDT